MSIRNRPLSPQAFALLAALADHAPGWRYGLELSAETGLKSGSLYPILMRLAERGLLESCWQEFEWQGRPPRHAYRITAQGRAALRAAPALMTPPKEALGMTLARWILRAATHNPPAPLRDWALAMRREFDEVRSGELGWALGCAATMVVARLRVEAFFWAMVIATPFVIGYLDTQMFWAFASAGHRYMTLYMTLSAFAAFPFAVLIGLYRPGRAVAPMLIGGLLLGNLRLTLWASYALHASFLGWWGLHGQIYGSPPFIGLAANLGAWYAGAKLGAALRRSPVSA